MASSKLTGTRLFWECFKLTRLHKFPLGSLVIIWPAAFGVAMASYATRATLEDFLVKIGLFTLGGTCLHSSFCVLNDIYDRDLDGQVERTKTRPLVTGAISLPLAWFVFLCCLSTTALLLSFANSSAVFFGMLSLPLHFIYPYSKRFTWWPQAWLGISNGWSFFVGWISVSGTEVSHAQVKAMLAMYGCMICWTIYFDTIYATQDRKDDERVGIKSTARLFGAQLHFITALFATAMVALLVTGGTFNDHGLPYFAVSCPAAAVYFLWQMASWDINNDQQSGELFKGNGYLGFVIFAGMAADVMWTRPALV
ncbi:UbiA prenyltransferase family [Vararia minispora EC-137]|uniref:UbiA prenyltransferase family n=1 Tax=Vararia minispora EC-137 TaxID=1314806 RepID=A0ACB8QUW7_9AGAM|nr:UbiA prenyltransferase family [Vararia minispora EC-137]